MKKRIKLMADSYTIDICLEVKDQLKAKFSFNENTLHSMLNISIDVGICRSVKIIRIDSILAEQKEVPHLSESEIKAIYTILKSIW